MEKNKGQGYRADLDKKKWGRTRKVSREGRITLPSPNETIGKSFEVTKVGNTFLLATSGAYTLNPEADMQAYIQDLKDINKFSEAKLKELKHLI